MSRLTVILLVLLVLCVLGVPQFGLWNHGYGLWPSGIGALIVLILLVLVLTGRL